MLGAHGRMQNEGSGEAEFMWTADPPAGHTAEVEEQEEALGPVEGTHIRLMCEYSVDMPLWDAGGPLPEDPDYLQQELGITPRLTADLAAWAAAWETDVDSAEHDAEGRRLFARLQEEIAPRFTVSLTL
jgi:hypothetical protein